MTVGGLRFNLLCASIHPSQDCQQKSFSAGGWRPYHTASNGVVRNTSSVLPLLVPDISVKHHMLPGFGKKTSVSLTGGGKARAG